MAILDLTRPLGAGASVPPGLPEFRHERPRAIATHGLNSSVVHMSVHTGTHLDAPRHTMDEGVGISGITLDRLIGEAVVCSIAGPTPRAIVAGDLEAAVPRIARGNFVLLSTGWATQPAPDGLHSWVSVEAADWLVRSGVRLIGLDTPTPEQPRQLRPPDFNFPAHHALLDRDVLVLENLADLRPIAGQRVRLYVLPLPLVDSDAAPVRVIAEY